MAFNSDLLRKSVGASRNVTYKFKELRSQILASQGKTGTKPGPFKGNEKLLNQEIKIEVSKEPLLPKWHTSYKDITTSFLNLDQDLRALEAIVNAKKKNAFTKESKEQETQISLKSELIVKQIQEINSNIDKITKTETSESDQNVKKNSVSSFKLKLKDLGLRFKRLQEVSNSYKPKILSDKVYNLCDDSDMDDGLIVLAPHINDGINSLAKNMIDLAEVFKELNDYVSMQGTIFDRIDCSIRATVDNTKQSITHLKAAEKHQKCSRASFCILLLVTTIVVLIVVLGLKVFL